MVAYYEKQLAATQLVQHRLQQQYNQLAEEKASLEVRPLHSCSCLQAPLRVITDCFMFSDSSVVWQQC